MTFPFSDISKCRVTSPYNVIRSDGIPHDGIDIVSDGDKTILSVSDGKVIRAGWNDSWGYYAVVTMADGRSIVYAHMHKGSLCVSAGNTIKAGEAIGLMGSTGNSTGPHLHIEIQTQYYQKGRTGDIAAFLGIENKIGKVKRLAEFKTGEEVLAYWVKEGIIDSPDYWQKALLIVKNLDSLLVKVANHYK